MKKYLMSFIDYSEIINVTADQEQLQNAKKRMTELGLLTDKGNIPLSQIDVVAVSEGPAFFAKLDKRLRCRAGGIMGFWNGSCRSRLSCFPQFLQLRAGFLILLWKNSRNIWRPTTQKERRISWMIPNREVFSYVDPDGNAPARDFLKQLEPKLQHKIHSQLRQLQVVPCSLRPPLVKAFRLERYKGMYELRTRLRKMVRIIFYLNEEEQIVLLHGFIKKHVRSTEQALEIARARKLALADTCTLIEFEDQEETECETNGKNGFSC